MIKQSFGPVSGSMLQIALFFTEFSDGEIFIGPGVCGVMHSVGRDNVWSK